VTRRRLDAELVRRGLVSSREEAREAVDAGLVLVAGAPATKPATMVRADEPLALSGSPRRYASRGGEKLHAALDRFAIEAVDRDCLDAGASTGGFTDCLLHAGARRVIAVDVGYGQLAWDLRNDDRVTVMERTNVRDLTPTDLPFAPDLIVADLSFISLTRVAAPLARLCADAATFVALVKPQFEAGPEDVGRGGVVRDPAVWRRVLGEVADAFSATGIGPQAVMASPLRGPAGNVEFLLSARRGAAPAVLDLDGAVADGEEVRRG
jgi:23S rRNA (cytidine1920-2'-O)/16S rRNA (cytidine1409-2'-O)-methyltransferase